MKSKSMELHKKNSPKKINCGIITLSDSISKGNGDYNDLSGKYIQEKLEEKYGKTEYKVIPDNKELLVETIEDMINKKVDIIFTTGGTGIESGDITIETVKELYDKELNGFGEIFRLKSYEELGSGALLSRATSGIYKKTIICSMPGSPNAVKTGLSIIYNEIGHLVKHAQK